MGSPATACVCSVVLVREAYLGAGHAEGWESTLCPAYPCTRSEHGVWVSKAPRLSHLLCTLFFASALALWLAVPGIQPMLLGLVGSVLTHWAMFLAWGGGQAFPKM